MRRVVTGIGTAVVLCAIVAGYELKLELGPPRSIASTSYIGAPGDGPAAWARDTSAVWRGATLDLTLWGSGSCPPVPVALVVWAQDTVEIAIDGRYGLRGCTADLSPRTSVLTVPGAVRDGAVLTVRLRYRLGPPLVLTVPRQAEALAAGHFPGASPRRTG
jgi:hypothetical protein